MKARTTKKSTASKPGRKRSGQAAPYRSSKGFAPRKIAVVFRPGTAAAEKTANALTNWLFGGGYDVYSIEGQRLGGKGGKYSKTIEPKHLDQLDWVIALGGDGTYLGAIRVLEGRQTPILGVNMGSLGFLTETRLEDLYTAIEDTMNGRMEFRPRAMLNVEVRRKGKIVCSRVALNDAVVERGSVTHLINIEISIGEDLVGQVKADALIVATPTGSTAYNLAAGGPILHPEAPAIVVTPVCPHALTSRPLIFPDNKKLVLRVFGKDKIAVLTVDGVRLTEVSDGDEVIVTRSKRDHFVIRKPSSNYFELLREKLKFGQRN